MSSFLFTRKSEMLELGVRKTIYIYSRKNVKIERNRRSPFERVASELEVQHQVTKTLTVDVTDMILSII